MMNRFCLFLLENNAFLYCGKIAARFAPGQCKILVYKALWTVPLTFNFLVLSWLEYCLTEKRVRLSNQGQME